MNGFNMIKDNGSVSICKGCDNQLDAFIDIFTEDEETPSPFKTIEDAELFAKIIVKLLEVVI